MSKYYAVIFRTILFACLGVVAVQMARFDARLSGIDREYEQLAAIRQAQEYAQPIVQLSEQLAAENATFTQVINRARTLLRDKDSELAASREALQQAVASLREQAEDFYAVQEQLKLALERVSQLQAEGTKLRELLREQQRLIEELRQRLDETTSQQHDVCATVL